MNKRYSCKHCGRLPRVRIKDYVGGGKIKVAKCVCPNTPDYYIAYHIWMKEHALGSQPKQMELELDDNKERIHEEN